jgi:hypothetical protein
LLSELTFWITGEIDNTGRNTIFDKPEKFEVAGEGGIGIRIELTNTAQDTIKEFSCEYYDVGAKLWLRNGCRDKAVVEKGSAHCKCNHLTMFGSGQWYPLANVDTPVFDDNEPPAPIWPGEDYEYMFLGCMNALYIAGMLWFTYILSVVILRRLDIGQAKDAYTEQLNDVMITRRYFKEQEPNTHMWTLR